MDSSGALGQLQGHGEGFASHQCLVGAQGCQGLLGCRDAQVDAVRHVQVGVTYVPAE